MSMTHGNIETVRAIYDAFGRADVPFILSQLTDDVDWASCPDSTAAPWHGIRIGKAGVRDYFQALGESLDVTDFTTLSLAANDSDVLVVTHFVATVRATNETFAMDIHHWWRFREGKVCLYRGTEDTLATHAALGGQAALSSGRSG